MLVELAQTVIPHCQRISGSSACKGTVPVDEHDQFCIRLAPVGMDKTSNQHTGQPRSLAVFHDHCAFSSEVAASCPMLGT
ncbi:hypothetical protein HYQ46_001149 [Verticillium longisporum]|nr:hypothetical protein HYQ46_001149 [Verticillium longisporum]